MHLANFPKHIFREPSFQILSSHRHAPPDFFGLRSSPHRLFLFGSPRLLLRRGSATRIFPRHITSLLLLLLEKKNLEISVRVIYRHSDYEEYQGAWNGWLNRFSMGFIFAYYKLYSKHRRSDRFIFMGCFSSRRPLSSLVYENCRARDQVYGDWCCLELELLATRPNCSSEKSILAAFLALRQNRDLRGARGASEKTELGAIDPPSMVFSRAIRPGCSLASLSAFLLGSQARCARITREACICHTAVLQL